MASVLRCIDLAFHLICDTAGAVCRKRHAPAEILFYDFLNTLVRRFNNFIRGSSV